MKQLLIDEEFSIEGQKFCFTKNGDKLILKSLGVGTRSKTFVPPTIEQVKEFFKIKGYVESAAEKFYEYYTLGNWHDGKGHPIKNWQQKASAVWFREDNKIKDTSPPPNKDGFLF